MKINSIHRHPAEIQVEAVLGHEQPYPEEFTLADRTAERMSRIRHGLAYVMNDLAPHLEGEQTATVNCWLLRILALVDITKMDAEGKL